ncbi:MAG: 3-hydroxyacyl-CoA dehydrogenase [Alphaproteobacteria bacterium]|nr:3-hydroxyacyl-CoA dehydrogenase [Alphaproteobacteria bacterium]
MQKIALIGGGLVGQAWAVVFARAGHPVTLYDASPLIMEQAEANIAPRLNDLTRFRLIDNPDAVLGRISYAIKPGDAVAGADYVQESVPERLDVKREVYAELDRFIGDDTIIGSSTSGIPASEFTENLACRARCLVAHPINPPSVTPLVELCPAPWTDAKVVERVAELMTSAGQSPIRVKKEVPGFVANRLQGALLAMALRLVEDGVCSVEDVDIAIKDGIGRRWSFIGPFETIDLNAPGGIKDYMARYGPLYEEIERSAEDPLEWSDALASRVEAERRKRLPADGIPERSEWRDRRLMALAAHKRVADEKIGK